jgi:hypothetical protein
MPIMNLSTSSSDQQPAAFLKTFAIVALGLLVGVLACLVVLDPYGTGRLTPLAARGIAETGPRMANASRLANPEFNAAIVGNSTIQLLSPERLLTATGRRFVQLSIPGTGPQEQTVLVQRLFATRGASIQTLVIGLEEQWCNVAYETKTAHPFPYWLYSLSDLSYAWGLFRFDTLEFVPRRIMLLMGKGKVARPDGFWDYEQIAGYVRPLDSAIRYPAVAGPINGRNAATPFLRRLIDAVPPTTDVIIIHPPIFVQTPPHETDNDRRNLAQCKSEIAGVLAGRSGTQILDFWIDNDLTRNPKLFFDHNHYSGELARRIEAVVAATLQKPR